MGNVFEHPSIIAVEALNMLLGYEYNITGTIDSPGFKLYIDGEIRDGVKHFVVKKLLTARHCNGMHLDEFIEKVIKPLMNDLAEKLQNLKKEYVSYTLPLAEDKICAYANHNNLVVRVVKNYNITHMSTEIQIDMALIEKGA